MGVSFLYKRIENGNFRWLWLADKALEITIEQYRLLIQGLEILAKRPIQEVTDFKFAT